MVPTVEAMERLLEAEGGFYTFADIVQLVHEKRMQSFVEGDTWVITQIQEYPRKRVLEVVYVIGSLHDIDVLEQRVIDFAKQERCTMLATMGRIGFSRVAKSPEWKLVGHWYKMELSNGV